MRTFQRQLAAVERGHNIGLVGSSARRIDTDGRALGYYYLKPLNHTAIVTRLRSLQPFCPHSSFFVPRQVYERLNGYKPHRLRAQDLDFMLRLSECEDLRFAFLPEPLIALRMHRNSITYDYSGGRSQLIHAVSALAEHLLRIEGLCPPEPAVTEAEAERVLAETGVLEDADFRRRLIVARLGFRESPGMALLDLTRTTLAHPSLCFRLPRFNRMKAKAAELAARNLAGLG